MIKGPHLQLRWNLPLFHNFKLFNIEASIGPHPAIQEEVAELLAKGAIEPLMGGTGFYSNILVVPM